MGSISSSPGSSTSSSAVTFNGISSYASDFQAILQRAVETADLPIQALQNEESDNEDKISVLQSLNPDVANLASAIAALGSLASSGGGLSASSSDSNTVSVLDTGATAPATYTISNIQSLASSAMATSAGFANSTSTPVSADGNVQLTVGATTYQLTLSSANNNLAGLASAINNADAGVTASILTTSGDDYLSISANSSGQAAIQLQDLSGSTDEVTNTGTGTETSTAPYVDTSTTPVSASGQMSLVVGSNTYQLDLTGNNNLTGLENAINNAGADVTASISSGANGYSLSISTNDSSAQTIQLNDASTNLITSSSAGSNAEFTLNGNIPVVQSNNTINSVIPGVSFTLENTTTGTQSVTLTLSADSSQLSDALQTFVGDYNTVATDATEQTGTSGGSLDGDLVIDNIMTDMQQLSSYWNPSGTSTIRSLSDLGVTFNDTGGQLTFDSSVISGLSNTQLSDAMNFLGSSNSGFAALANNFTEVSDPISGIIETEETAYQTEDTNLATEISDKQAQVTQMQSSMTSQLEAADALCAELESEQNTVDASVQSLDYVAFGKEYSSTGE